MLDAAALAAILDPERKVQGWWDTSFRCSLCKQSTDGPARERSMCYWNTHEGEVAAVLAPSYEFTGPANLHTAREHCWRMEEWLEAHPKRTYTWRRFVDFKDKYKTIVFDDGAIFTEDYNHAAALSAAIERINNEQHPRSLYAAVAWLGRRGLE